MTLKNKKILFINPKIKDDPPFFPPYALLWLAASLEKNGFTTFIYDRNVETENLKQVLARVEPDLVGISCLTGKLLLDVDELLKTTKNFDPRIKIVLGGVHVYFFPESSLRKEEVDFIVVGEGEVTLLELVKNLDKPQFYRRIKGLGYKDKKGKIVINPPREFIKDLNTLPDPAWHLLKVEKYFNRTFYAKRMIILNTSRGCPNQCSFCYNQAFNKRTYRYLSADRILNQVEYFYRKYKVDGFHFYEDEFDVDSERVKRFCNGLIRKKIKIGWQFGGRVNYVNRGKLELLKKAGCQRIEFGVESGSQRVLDFLQKEITIGQIKEAFRLTNEVGIKADALFMIGLPTETKEELKQTLTLIENLPTFSVVCNIFKPYPGTKLFDFCVEKYNIKIPKTFKDFAESYNFDSTSLVATDIPIATLRKIKDEMTGKNILDTLKVCFKELRFGYLFSLIKQKLRHSGENRLFLLFFVRLKELTRINTRDRM